MFTNKYVSKFVFKAVFISKKVNFKINYFHFQISRGALLNNCDVLRLPYCSDTKALV